MRIDSNLNYIAVTLQCRNCLSYFARLTVTLHNCYWVNSNKNYRTVTLHNWFWIKNRRVHSLDGRNRAVVIAESLARVIAAIRIASAHWSSYLPPNTGFGPHRLCVRCAAIRIARLAFIGVVFVPHGTAEWPVRVGRVRWTLAMGDWRFGPSKVHRNPKIEATKDDSKVTPANRPQSVPKVTQKWLRTSFSSQFRVISSHFWVGPQQSPLSHLCVT